MCGKFSKNFYKCEFGRWFLQWFTPSPKLKNQNFKFPTNHKCWAKLWAFHPNNMYKNTLYKFAIWTQWTKIQQKKPQRQFTTQATMLGSKAFLEWNFFFKNRYFFSIFKPLCASSASVSGSSMKRVPFFPRLPILWAMNL